MLQVHYVSFTYSPRKLNFKRVKRPNHGGGLVAWGMLMHNCLIAVKILEGKQNSAKYIAIMKSFLCADNEFKY